MVENQHKKITGYRNLSQAEIDAMNEVKALGEKLSELIESLQNRGLNPPPDPRLIAIAKTELQKGFMFLNRSIAKPTSFC